MNIVILYTIAVKKFPFCFSERDSNSPVRSDEDLNAGPGPLPGNPSLNCSPAATRSTSGDSASVVDPSSENPSTSSQGGNSPGEADTPTISSAGGDLAMDTSTGPNPHTDSEGGNRPGETGTPIISSSSPGGDSAVNPISSGERDCPVSKARNTLDTRRATGDSSSGDESPIRNIRG